MRNIIDRINESALTWVNRLIPFNSKLKLINLLQPSSLLAKNLQTLQNRAKTAIQFIKKNSVMKGGYRVRLDTLPWYLLIGPKDSGKSSLLSESNIKFALEGSSDRFSDRPTSVATCDWWVTSESVLIDTPGSYMAIDDKKSSLNDELWLYLLELIQTKKAKKSLGGVIVAISTTQLLDKDYREELINSLRCRLVEVQQTFGKKIPVYFNITKVDLLPGFQDFFNDCSHEELTQAWGVTMPESSNIDSLATIFTARFNALVKILNNQVIMRMHHERDVHAKSNIKSFPLHIETIKDEFVNLLNALLTLQVHFCLKGFYLTSATQDNLANQDLSQPEVFSATDESGQVLDVSHMDVEKCPYFTKQFILQGILQ